MAKGVVLALLLLVAVVFVVFFVIGMAMPVIPLHVDRDLGLGAFVVGLVAGGQFAAALISRIWAGGYADRWGPKRAIVVGVAVAVVAGLLYLASLRVLGAPVLSVAILLVGRCVLGVGESFVITGAFNWGLAIGGSDNAGKIISWLGTAMYGAFALGAPVGSALHSAWGFSGIALATVFAPLVAWALIAGLRDLAPRFDSRPSYSKVARTVALPGFGLALSSVGYAAITIFVALIFDERGWEMAWAAFTTLSGAFILARVVFGHLPDKIGGARVALVCVLVEAAGLMLVWLAPSSGFVFAGAAFIGFGYSLVYPAFGVDLVHNSSENRGLVMGAYSACLNLGLGLSGPALGLVASQAGVSAVFLASALLVGSASIVALKLRNRTPTEA